MPRSLRCARRLVPVSLLVLVANLLSIPADAGPNVSGRWTDKLAPAAIWIDTEGVPTNAVHMILTRGYDGYHSQILWYDSNHHFDGYNEFHGGLMGWNPESTPAEGDCSNYPASRLTPLTVGGPTTNVFCTGHSALASGRILITGGTEAGEVGMTTSIVFDPATRTWTSQPEMAQRRWYPTNTTLPDGTVLVSSGSSFGQFHGFGGRDAAGVLATDSLEFLGMTDAGEWSGRGKSVDIVWPVARDAHASCWNPTNSEWTLFGGRNQNGTLRNDTYFMYQNADKDDREDYTAVNVASGVGDPRPSPRAWGSLVAPNHKFLLFGGLDNGGAKNDTHELYRTFHPITGSPLWHWREVGGWLTGTPPSPRHGHAALWDSTNKKMLVFGGATTAGAAIDNTLYALSIADTGAVGWSVASVTPDPDAGSPVMRDGHVLVEDPYVRNSTEHGAPVGYERRFVLFGGRSNTTLLNDLWVLWIPNPGAGSYQWKRVGAWYAPSGRYRLAGGFDYNDRFVITGGDLGGTVTDETWAVSGFYMTAPAWPPIWVALPPNPYGPRTNHSMFPRRTLWARQPERFDPATASWAIEGKPKSQDWYPFHFVLPNADSLRVLATGPDTSTYVLNLSASPPTWRFVAKSSAAGDSYRPFRGGASVMYLPGSFMKCGSRDTDAPTGAWAVATTKTLEISTTNFGTPPTTWTSRQDMGSGRVNHNLVILPNGKVLANGGTKWIRNNANAEPVFTPQIWTPSSKTWSPITGPYALAADPTIRGYHSNAILLPDGRVLAASGESYVTGDAADLDSKRITIFCPPYLFDSSGNLKSRPTIVAAPDSIEYGSSFEIRIPNGVTISTVCLVKPAASTHGFNQDQRYVPLSFEACDTMLAVTAPATGRWAPPGDYMLFIVRSDDMPSIAKWVRVGATDPNSELPFCESGGFAMMSGGSEDGWGEDALLAGEETGWSAQPLSGLTAADGSYSVRLRQGDSSQSTIEGLRLTAIDHAAGVEAFATRDRILLGACIPATGATTGGRDVTSSAVSSHDLAVDLATGEGLEVTLAIPAKTGASVPLVFAARSVPAGTTGERAGGLTIQGRSAEGDWIDREARALRPGYTTFVVDSCGTQVRLVASGRVQIRGVGSLDVSECLPRPAALPIESLTRDDVALSGETLQGQDASGVLLGPGSTLMARWKASAVPSGLVRSVFVDVRSVTEDAGTFTSSLAARSTIEPAPAWTFSLATSRPNPVTSDALIAYSLAHPARVRIRIHDVAGRLVRRLVDEDAAAGPHEARWDGRNDQGRAVANGVYFYRMETEGWQGQQKLLLVRQD